MDAMGTAAPVFDAGSTAWMLTSSALVLLMVPGLALFYGGMVRRKNVLTTMMMSFVAMAVIGVQWVLIGYALAFGKTQGGFIGWDSTLVALSLPLETRAMRWAAVPALLVAALAVYGMWPTAAVWVPPSP